MPPEDIWDGFFDPKTVLLKLRLNPNYTSVVDLGCGYGTFTIPAAKLIRGVVYAFDIDPDMVAVTELKAKEQRLRNIKVIERDFVEEGTGLADGVADYVMLFNILHAEKPEVLLSEARRILKEDGGMVGVMHWNYSDTPRGPSMGIRLQPTQCMELVERHGFMLELSVPMDLPPYHYGFVGMR